MCMKVNEKNQSGGEIILFVLFMLTKKLLKDDI